MTRESNLPGALRTNSVNFTGWMLWTLRLIGQRVAAGGGAQNLILRAVDLDRERDAPALDDLFVIEFQCGPWFQPDLFQDGFRLAFQFRVNPAFGDGAHGLNVARTRPFVKAPGGPIFEQAARAKDCADENKNVRRMFVKGMESDRPPFSGGSRACQKAKDGDRCHDKYYHTIHPFTTRSKNVTLV